MNKDTVAEKNYLKPNWSEKILRTTIQSYSEDLQLAKKIMNEINDSNVCQFKQFSGGATEQHSFIWNIRPITRTYVT